MGQLDEADESCTMAQSLGEGDKGGIKIIFYGPQLSLVSNITSIHVNCQSEKPQFGQEMEFPRKIGTKLPQPVRRMPVKTGPFNFEGNPSIDAVFRRPDPPRHERHGDAGQECLDRLPLHCSPATK
jgi:hypothetical protein